jgi:hypothetical protein
VRGPRRPDIEAHNKLNAQERRRRRNEGGTFLPIPLDSDSDAEDNTRPPSPISTDQQPNSPTTDEEPTEDHTNTIIRNSPLIDTRPFASLIHEYTMATATATTTTATTTTKPKIVASVQKKLDTAMKRQPSNNPGGGGGNPRGGSNPTGGGGNPGGGGGCYRPLDPGTSPRRSTGISAARTIQWSWMTQSNGKIGLVLFVYASPDVDGLHESPCDSAPMYVTRSPYPHVPCPLPSTLCPVPCSSISTKP